MLDKSNKHCFWTRFNRFGVNGDKSNFKAKPGAKTFRLIVSLDVICLKIQENFKISNWTAQFVRVFSVCKSPWNILITKMCQQKLMFDYISIFGNWSAASHFSVVFNPRCFTSFVNIDIFVDFFNFLAFLTSNS